jgi:hypothetical protein
MREPTFVSALVSARNLPVAVVVDDPSRRRDELILRVPHRRRRHDASARTAPVRAPGDRPRLTRWRRRTPPLAGEDASERARRRAPDTARTRPVDASRSRMVSAGGMGEPEHGLTSQAAQAAAAATLESAPHAASPAACRGPEAAQPDSPDSGTSWAAPDRLPIQRGPRARVGVREIAARQPAPVLPPRVPVVILAPGRRERKGLPTARSSSAASI